MAWKPLSVKSYLINGPFQQIKLHTYCILCISYCKQYFNLTDNIFPVSQVPREENIFYSSGTTNVEFDKASCNIIDACQAKLYQQCIPTRASLLTFSRSPMLTKLNCTWGRSTSSVHFKQKRYFQKFYRLKILYLSVLNPHYTSSLCSLTTIIINCKQSKTSNWSGRTRGVRTNVIMVSLFKDIS